MIAMTQTPAAPQTQPADEDRNAVFVRERPHLLAIAFRLLGSETDAQDIVQEAWLRYAHADLDEVRNVQAWLTTVVSRLCLDQLRRARFVSPVDVPETAGGDDPAEIALLASELTDAWQIVLDTLTPPQRVALILHDVFGVPFTEVAHVLDITPGAAKKVASRARGRLRERQPASAAHTDPREARRVVGAFLTAVQHGDLATLLALLAPDVTRTGDAQLLPPGVPQWVRGAQVVVREASANQVRAQRSRLVSINGRPGIAVRSPRGVEIAMVFLVANGRIVHLDVVADPQRLARLRIEG